MNEQERMDVLCCVIVVATKELISPALSVVAFQEEERQTGLASCESSGQNTLFSWYTYILNQSLRSHVSDQLLMLPDAVAVLNFLVS